MHRMDLVSQKRKHEIIDKTQTSIQTQQRRHKKSDPSLGKHDGVVVCAKEHAAWGDQL